MTDSRLTLHDIEALWARHPIFAAAGSSQCLEFARRYPARVEGDGVVLASCGDPARELFVVLSGTVRLFHTAADGRQVTVKLLRAPNTAGTLELLHDIPRLTNIGTVKHAVIAAFPRADYLELLRSCPEACFEQVQHIAAAFLVAARNEQQAFTNLSARIASLLLSYAEYFGRQDRGLLIDYPLSQQDIAHGVGTVRRSVAGLMAQWREEGVLTKRRGRIVLLDVPYLEDAAELSRGSICYQMGMPLDHLHRPSALQPARLEVTAGRGSMTGRTLTVEQEIVIGCAPPAHFLVADDLVSPQHCRIFRAKTGGRFWIEDLGSENGTLLNDAPVRRAVLRSGDAIRIGGTRLVFEVQVGT
jgi:CRP-like cAMP-binding protein